MEAGTPIRFITPLISRIASLSATPGGRLKEMVEATNRPWWLTASGMLPAVKWVTALSGTMVSALVLTAAPVDAVPFPVLPIELSARLRAASAATDAAVEADALELLPLTVPATAWVACTPPTEPPEVLT